MGESAMLETKVDPIATIDRLVRATNERRIEGIVDCSTWKNL